MQGIEKDLEYVETSCVELVLLSSHVRDYERSWRGRLRNAWSGLTARPSDMATFAHEGALGSFLRRCSGRWRRRGPWLK